jgi:hypothetical protein
MRMGHPGLRCLLGHVAAHQLGNYVVGTVDRHPRRSEDAAATGQATDRRAGRHRGGRRPRGRVVSVVEPAGLDRSQQELFGMAGRWLRRGRTGRSASRTTLRPRPLRRGRCRVRWRANPTCRSTRCSTATRSPCSRICNDTGRTLTRSPAGTACGWRAAGGSVRDHLARQFRRPSRGAQAGLRRAGPTASGRQQQYLAHAKAVSRAAASRPGRAGGGY